MRVLYATAFTSTGKGVDAVSHEEHFVCCSYLHPVSDTIFEVLQGALTATIAASSGERVAATSARNSASSSGAGFKAVEGPVSLGWGLVR